jgi:hypothetical protein
MSSSLASLSGRVSLALEAATFLALAVDLPKEGLRFGGILGFLG